MGSNPTGGKNTRPAFTGILVRLYKFFFTFSNWLPTSKICKFSSMHGHFVSIHGYLQGKLVGIGAQ